ncbi:hypothetical protein TL16_g00769 [Triparma laevis f. inornata]|uniref:Uncharacterized protein n=1 Tax=Triparma laevis f. inornata TaxID=1714386 RepID=A0A9W6ZHF8_9STRA|nr:hypothetical protein TL16_g00769 [Triparma laevis f. inornata]
MFTRLWMLSVLLLVCCGTDETLAKGRSGRATTTTTSKLEDTLELINPNRGFFRPDGPYFAQNLYTGEHNLQVALRPQLPNLRKNCSEPLLSDGQLIFKVGAQNYEGIPSLESDACIVNFKKPYATVSWFANCIPFPVRNATEYVYRVGLGAKGVEAIDKVKRGYIFKNKREKKLHDAFVANATVMLRNLQPSTREGADFTLNEPWKSSPLLRNVTHSFQTCFEHIEHDFLAPENCFSSTMSVTPVDTVGDSKWGQHRCTVSVCSGVRFPSLPWDEWGISRKGLRESLRELRMAEMGKQMRWRKKRGLGKGGEEKGKKGKGKEEQRALKQLVAPVPTTRHVIYEKPRFTRFVMEAASVIPLSGPLSGRLVGRGRPSAELALKSHFVSSLNSSVPLHMRDMNGFLLGRDMRGWSAKDHGPFRDGMRGTGEFRFFTGDNHERSLCWVFFGDFLSFSRTKKKTTLIEESRLMLEGGKKRLPKNLEEVNSQVARVRGVYDENFVTKTAMGMGVRFKFKGMRLKIDFASLNSGQAKVNFGIGNDFGTKRKESSEFNGF